MQENHKKQSKNSKNHANIQLFYKYLNIYLYFLFSSSLEVPTVQNNTSFSSSSPSKSKIVVVKDDTQLSTISSRATTPVQAIAASSAVQQVQRTQLAMARPPGAQITQLTCCEVPGDQPIIQFVNVLDPQKMPPGQTVTKLNGVMKIQVNIKFQLKLIIYS